MPHRPLTRPSISAAHRQGARRTMAKFVRCMEGHAFDSEISDTCPVCGATVWGARPGPVQDRRKDEGGGGVVPPRKPWPLYAGIAVVVLALGGGAAWVTFFRSPPAPVPTPVPAPTPPPMPAPAPAPA